MDPTLRQLLQELVNVSAELERLRRENEMLKAELTPREDSTVGPSPVVYRSS